MEHPENILLVVDIVQHHCNQKVVALTVAKLKVEVAVSHDHLTDFFGVRLPVLILRFADEQIRSSYNLVFFY